MLSEEKIIHTVHVLLNGLEKSGMVTYPAKEKAVREAKRICLGFVSKLSDVEDIARRKIASQANPPPEHSQQWDNLYAKYCEEEMAKWGD